MPKSIGKNLVARSKSSAIFDLQYSGLNTAQREAVDAIEGPVMVIAGPGTGKTTILTLRIANILRVTDTPPSGILAITYTDAGVKAMRAKLQGIIGSRCHEVAIHTFHSFASAMIAEYHSHFVHLDGLTVMTDVEQESLIRRIITDAKLSDLRPAGKPDAYVSSIIRGIDDSKREAQTPEMVEAHAKAEIERITNDPESISTRGATKGKLKALAEEEIEKCKKTVLFAEVYRRYENEKLAGKRMDFNDLIIEFLVALRGDELLLRLIQERFLYVMVDEHQDTNDAQNFIIAHIAEFFETPNLFIVGDEKQAIYRFQGASVENFLLLRNRWPAMKVISLTSNYRSHQGIIDVSHAMIEHNYESDEQKELRVKLKAAGESKKLGEETSDIKKIQIITGENVAASEARLVSELRKIISSEPKATIAVITRRNRDVERVIQVLESAGISVSSERSLDIFHHPIGSLFFDLLEYLHDPSRLDALGKTVAAGLWSLDFEKATAAIKSLRSGQLNDAVSNLPQLVRLQRMMLNDGAVGFIIHAAELSGFAALVARDPIYVHVWRGIVTLAESLTRDSHTENPAELIGLMLAYRISAESKTVHVSVGAPDFNLKAMTAHRSKGLEFDYVFMPYATEESWIGRTRGSSFVLPKKSSTNNDVRDLRRLFYVALTRARKHVVILSALEESDGKALTPVRFIAELGMEGVEQTSMPRVHVDQPRNESGLSAANDAAHMAGTKLANMAKEMLLTSGLSVTALNHFLNCPNKFLYESVLKLPRAPAAAAEKGTAMHEAISRIWNEKDRSKDVIERIINEAVSDHLTNSFLPSLEKDAVKKELLADAPIVAAALEEHFRQNGQVATERWVETQSTGTYEGREITIPIHGKLDAVIDDGARLAVFDYKTRQSMSLAEIKGETKNSSGDYWRQLIFYRLLLTGDSFWKNRSVSPALVFISPDKKGRCPTVFVPVSDQDMEIVGKQIQELIDSVWSGKLVASRCSEPSCEWCGLRSAGLF